jgi:hypothetical protein
MVVLLAGAAQAQPAPPTESVTVTGARSRQVLDRFVQSTRMTGKLARWEDGVCPSVKGLSVAAAKFIVERIKAVAWDVGAPAIHNVRCRPNVEILFTPQPQSLLDDIRRQSPILLGYHDTESQRDRSAIVSRPIQSWYVTQTVDVRGHPEVDDSRRGGGVEIVISPMLPPIFIPHATSPAVTGSRLGDGLRSDFQHILIVADSAKLGNFGMGELADYIAMLALTRLSNLDTCQQLPSIVNLLAPGCSDPVQALTANDLGYLRGVYKMGPDRNFRSQQDEIAYQMQQTQDGK